VEVAREVYQKWYGSGRWKRLRKLHLSRRPFCQCPHHDGQRIPANVVDHIQAHKGDVKLFWNTKNLQSMTKQCHDKFKQSQESGGHGFDMGCNEKGEPLNADHPWFKGE